LQIYEMILLLTLWEQTEPDFIVSEARPKGNLSQKKH
jgi:hypothetical protein